MTPPLLGDLETSGDPLVDRRFDYALQLAERGEAAAAIDLLRQALDLRADWPPMWFYLAGLLEQAALRDDALAAYKTCLALDPADRLGASIRLSLMGAAPAPKTLPGGYVESLFDQYAPRFDRALVETLDYTVPQQIYDVISAYRPAGENTERILDLGCGTGLAGELFTRRAAYLNGVDLSEGMIAQAAAKQIYHSLTHAPLESFLSVAPPSAEAYDVVLAADVFVYIGALDFIMNNIADWLLPGGLFAFSVQQTDSDGWILGADHRFAHSKAYLERILAAAGLTVRSITPSALRKDQGADVMGWLVLAEKPIKSAGTGLATFMAKAGLKQPGHA